MSTNLIDIQNQIQKLQKQAADIKSKEFDSTVQDILARMAAFGITVKDLQTANSTGRKGRKKSAAPAGGKTAASKPRKAVAAVEAKYRGPNGETWSGRGLMPRWMASLVAQGQKREDFAIKT